MKGVKSLLPIMLLVAILACLVGMTVSSGLRITPTIDAIGQDKLDNSSAYDPIKNKQLFVELAEKLMPATVNISTTKTVKRKATPYHQFEGDDTFRDFFGDEFFERFFGHNLS